jgi:ceramide glucosyltransferase
MVRRMQRRYPHIEIDLVIDPTPHGTNRKVANLINMLPSAHHELLVIADSDLHCAEDYLQQIVAGFDDPKIGLVTTLYAGLAANGSLAARLGASAINHGFLPGALMSRDLGRQDCLGATMALRRATLTAIGGFQALVDHLADDNVLGEKVRALGLGIRIAGTVPATTVPETTLSALFRHELRWSRTILSLVPVAFALSSIQFPLFWAMLAWLVSGNAWVGLLVPLSWAVRALAARGIDRSLGLVRHRLASPVPLLLLPLRDAMSMASILASYASDKVEWRGQMMHTRPASQVEPDPGAETTTARQGTVLS